MKLLNKLFNCIFKTPTNNMYKRLNNLFLYFQIMDLNEDKIVVDTIINNCLDYGVTFTFKSNAVINNTMLLLLSRFSRIQLYVTP